MAVLNGGEMSLLDKIRGKLGKRTEPRRSAREIADEARQRKALGEIVETSKALPAFVKAASIDIDGDLLSVSADEPPTPEQIAGMSDEELEMMLRLANDQRRPPEHARALSECVENLESASGWELADYLAGEIRVIIESYEHAAELGRTYYDRVSAEVSKRKRAAEEEARRREYIKANRDDFIEALIAGDDERISEIRGAVENPPEIAEAEPDAVTTVWSGYAPNEVFEAGGADDLADNEAANFYRMKYDEQNARRDGAGED